MEYPEFPDEQDIAEKMGELAEIDLGLPFRTFQIAMDKAGILHNDRIRVMTELRVQIGLFEVNQVKHYREVYNLANGWDQGDLA